MYLQYVKETIVEIFNKCGFMAKTIEDRKVDKSKYFSLCYKRKRTTILNVNGYISPKKLSIDRT